MESFELPSNHVLVNVNERMDVVNNLPSVIGYLTSDQKRHAMYVSKFVASAAAGLFDAALNYLWNETIRNLREKVVKFDLKYFYDSIVSDPDRRSKFKSEEDLVQIEDWELIKGCKTTGIITEIGYRHLDYIRDMRNWASAAHPNQNELSGLQLIAWLQTCIREVLSKEPSGPVIEVRKLLWSLRNEQLYDDHIPPIETALSSLPRDLAESLLRTMQGMYTEVDLEARVRNNVKQVSPAVWKVSPDSARYGAGLTLARLQANGEISRAKLAREFLELVDGLTYLPKEKLELEINNALDFLMTAHNGFDNFHHEYTPARQLVQLIPASIEVPTTTEFKFVKTVVMCKIGNGYGVAWAAEHLYDRLISGFSDRQIFRLIDLLNDGEVRSRLQLGGCQSRFRVLIEEMAQKAVNAQLKQALEYIFSIPLDKLHQMHKDSKFRQYRLAIVNIK